MNACMKIIIYLGKLRANFKFNKSLFSFSFSHSSTNISKVQLTPTFPILNNMCMQEKSRCEGMTSANFVASWQSLRKTSTASLRAALEPLEMRI